MSKWWKIGEVKLADLQKQTGLSLLLSFEETKSDSLINTRKNCGTIIKTAAILKNVGQGYGIQKMDLNTKLLRSALC